MTRFFLPILAGLVLLPTVASARTQEVRCGISHHTRAGGTELRSTAIIFENGDLENTATIERLTIRGPFGEVIHDSGPAAGIDHPLNQDFTPPLDITRVPPGGAFYLRTNELWGRGNPPGGSQIGSLMSVTVQASKEGDPKLLQIRVRQRSRDRFFDPDGSGPFEGRELSSNAGACFPVR